MDLATLNCWSLSARQGVPAARREAASFQMPNTLDAFRARVCADARNPGPQAAFVYVGTCHRIEIYSFGIEAAAVRAAWESGVGLRLADLARYDGLDCYRHLLKVISSLESEVLGETQITGQVRDAVDLARKSGALHGTLDRVFQVGLRAAKRVRNLGHFSAGTVSVAHVAVDGLYDVFESIEGKQALVAGAGPMAEQAVERLLNRGARVSWTNRTRSRIENHPRASEVRIFSFDELAARVWDQDVSVLATSSPVSLLTRSQLQQVRTKTARADGPRVLLDLSLPRNVSEDIRGFAGFYLRNVDEFSNRAAANLDRRQSGLSLAEQVVEEEVRALQTQWREWSRGPLVKELVQTLESSWATEVEALRTHLELEKNQEIEYLTRRIFSKFLHNVLEEIEALEGPEAENVLKVWVRVWRQGEEWPQQKNLLQLRNLRERARHEVQQSLKRYLEAKASP